MPGTMRRASSHQATGLPWPSTSSSARAAYGLKATCRKDPEPALAFTATAITAKQLRRSNREIRFMWESTMQAARAKRVQLFMSKRFHRQTEPVYQLNAPIRTETTSSTGDSRFREQIPQQPLQTCRLM